MSTKPMKILTVDDQDYEVVDEAARNNLEGLNGENIPFKHNDSTPISEKIDYLLANEYYSEDEEISLFDFYLSCWNSGDHLYFSVPLTKKIPLGLMPEISGKFYIRLTGNNPTGTVLSNNTLDSLGHVACNSKDNCVLVTVTRTHGNLWANGIGVVVGAAGSKIQFANN